jgi:predicted Zn-dependent protease with MMP-like domain
MLPTSTMPLGMGQGIQDSSRSIFLARIIHVVCHMEHDAVERVNSSASINDQDQVGLYKGKTMDSRVSKLAGACEGQPRLQRLPQ